MYRHIYTEHGGHQKSHRVSKDSGLTWPAGRSRDTLWISMIKDEKSRKLYKMEIPQICIEVKYSSLLSESDSLWAACLKLVHFLKTAIPKPWPCSSTANRTSDMNRVQDLGHLTTGDYDRKINPGSGWMSLTAVRCGTWSSSVLVHRKFVMFLTSKPGFPGSPLAPGTVLSAPGSPYQTEHKNTCEEWK